MDTPKLLQLMVSDDVRLSKSDKKLAEIIQKDPRGIIHLPIAKLARRADVSEPTVNRFCHKIGCNGYPDFKVKLAQEVSRNGELYIDNMDRSDSTMVVMEKIMSSITSSVKSISTSTNPRSIDKAADLIANCKTVYFFGMGASGPVALDAQHKFFRFGMSVAAHTDYINQRMICSMASEEDVAVFISYTGRTSALIESAKIAKDSNVPIIGLTRDGTPLANHCNVVLNAVTAEDTDMFTPMTSRIIHLAIIDMLATTTLLKLGDKVEKQIRSIRKNLEPTLISGD